jgi:hypothetical protein
MENTVDVDLHFLMHENPPDQRNLRSIIIIMFLLLSYDII